MSECAKDYVLSPPAKQAEEGPAAVAKMTTEVANLAIAEPARRIDFASTLLSLFRNRSHGELSIAFGRWDGSIGRIDPELAPRRLMMLGEA